MSAKTPIRTVFDGSDNATGLAEFQSGEFIALTHGGLGASLSIGSAGQVLKVNSGASALEFGNVEAVFNIDGMTDGTSITLADGDVFAISDGGTEKRITASQIKTYVAPTAGSTAITSLDIDGGTDIGAALADADLLIVDDGAGGTNRKMAASRIKTYVADITLTTAAQTNITSLGTLTSLTVDDITIDGSTISDSGSMNITSGSSLTVDVDGAIRLDAGSGGNGIQIRDDGTEIVRIHNSSSDVILETKVSDKDLFIKGNDGGSTITALTFDMSEAGAATFNDKVTLGANKSIEFGDSGETISGDGTDLTIATSNDVTIDSARDIFLDGDQSIKFMDGGSLYMSLSNSSGVRFTSQISDNDILFRGNDGGSFITALTLDMSAAGAATFNDKITLGANKTIEFGDSGETISGDGTDLTISSSRNVTIDADSAISLDADSNGIVNFKDGGSKYFVVQKSSSNAILSVDATDGDMIFKGDDGGSVITALTLDMSNAGAATFNNNVTVGGDLIVNGTTTTVNSTTVTIDDPIFTLGGDSAPSSDDNKDRGIEFRYHTGSAAKVGFFGYDDSASAFTFIADATNSSEVFSGSAGDVVFGSITGTTLTANGGVVVDNITIDGTEIDLSSGDLTLDVAGKTVIDSDNGGTLQLLDGGTSYLKLFEFSNYAAIESMISDNDLKIRGNDGGSFIDALTFDMSEAGAATFNSHVTLGNSKELRMGASGDDIVFDGTNLLITATNGLILDGDQQIMFNDGGVNYGAFVSSSTRFTIHSQTSDKDFAINVNDGGSQLDALIFDASEAGAATFNSTIKADGGKDVILGKNQGTNFTNSLLIGHATTGTLDSAQNNLGVGIGALDALTSGDSNVAIGYNAGTAITSGGFNVLMGRQAGEAITTTFTTTAIGDQSFKTANTNNNTGLGASAGLHTTGGSNTAVGRSAGQGTAGQSSYTNAALLGNDAGKALTTGSHNILLGSTSGDNLTTGSGNVLIGSGIDADAVDSARTLKIAGYDGSSTTTWISGDSAGALTFADKVVLGANKVIELGDSSDTLKGDGTKIQLNSSGRLDLLGTSVFINGAATTAILLSSQGVQFGDFTKENTNNLVLRSSISDGDFIIRGNDGGSNVDALTFDMSAAGAATFNDKVVLAANKTIEFGDSGETISGDGTNLTIASSNNIIFDAAQDILLDSGNGAFYFNDDGSTIGSFINSSSNFVLNSNVSDKDLIFKGNDGGSTITALTLDMSEAGAATFNDKVILGANKSIEFGDAGESISGDGTSLTIASSHNTVIDSANQIILDAGNGLNIYFRDDDVLIGQVLKSGNNDFKLKGLQSGKLFVLEGLDSGGSLVTALSLDMSAAGAATFGDKVIMGTNKEVQFVDTNESIKSDGSKLIIKSGGTTFNFPTADGDADQVLTTDGSGTLSFAAAGGAGSGFSESTITTLPGQDGNFDLAKTNNTGDAETGLTAGGTDSFGVALGSVYTMMEPVGASTTNNTDLGASETHVGA